MIRVLEKWCKDYVFKWLHVEREPPEGWISYCFYKLYFRWRKPHVAIKGLMRGVKEGFEIQRTDFLPLSVIEFTHPVANDITDLKLKKRIAKLKKIPTQAQFSQDEINVLMPSINNVRVIWLNNQHWVCDGNGRVYAFKQTHPNAQIEVDIIKPIEKLTKKGDPKVGELRVKRKLAILPIECEENKSWIGFYYSLEEYVKDYESYTPIRRWVVRKKIPEGYSKLTGLLIDPDLTTRKFGQMLYKIMKEGDSTLITPEENE